MGAKKRIKSKFWGTYISNGRRKNINRVKSAPQEYDEHRPTRQELLGYMAEDDLENGFPKPHRTTI